MNFRHYDKDELIINYHDVCVYGRDLALLEDATAWLNDTCIQFQLTRLQQCCCHSRTAAATISKVLLMDPAVLSFFMHQCHDDDDEEMDEFASSYNQFSDIERVFLPINDNMASTVWHVPETGTHWSLLVIMNVTSNVQFLHFDSVSNGNLMAARKVASKWFGMLRRLGRMRNKSNDSLNNNMFFDVPAPQQKNGYDCGVHVLLTVEAILVGHDHGEEDIVTADHSHLLDRLTVQLSSNPELCNELRCKIACDIRALAAAEPWQH